ncbi:hypothetical protein BRC68_12510 [Halobacteriales archaeon QH_6_64_20]|nr:MAG: hypothetical protein BRC68_12510 [Halobacteriales archaeon QH_6_64_20]
MGRFAETDHGCLVEGSPSRFEVREVGCRIGRRERSSVRRESGRDIVCVSRSVVGRCVRVRVRIVRHVSNMS